MEMNIGPSGKLLCLWDGKSIEKENIQICFTIGQMWAFTQQLFDWTIRNLKHHFNLIYARAK